MKAFEIHLNGLHLFTAGIGENGVLSTVITWVGGSPPRPNAGFFFRAGGVDGGTGEHVEWSVPAIGVGDEVTVKIIETDQVSPEHHRHRPLESDRAAHVAELKKVLQKLEQQEE